LITLADAVKTGRLQQFIAQEEARGVAPIDRAELNHVVATLIKARPPKIEHRILHLAEIRAERELA